MHIHKKKKPLLSNVAGATSRGHTLSNPRGATLFGNSFPGARGATLFGARNNLGHATLLGEGGTYILPPPLRIRDGF
jgi:hypothetical protein